jgi:NAD(P)-dependent dehydrogenase (short-subunit alcohol dehydrogenase family)
MIQKSRKAIVALELAEHGIEANAIYPGRMATLE